MPSRKTLVTLLALWALAIAVFVDLQRLSEQRRQVSTTSSKDCEQFKCQRRIVGVNGITDKVEFEIEGSLFDRGRWPRKSLHALIVIVRAVEGRVQEALRRHVGQHVLHLDSAQGSAREHLPHQGHPEAAEPDPRRRYGRGLVP
jgi:hypothetical protein